MSILVYAMYMYSTHIYIYTYDSGNYVYLLGVECGSKSTPNDAGCELIQLAPSHWILRCRFRIFFFAIWIETPLLGANFSVAISPEVWICFTCFWGRLGPIALNLWQPRSPLVAGSLAAFIAGNSITAKLRCRKKTDTKMWPTATHLSQRWSVVLR